MSISREIYAAYFDGLIDKLLLLVATILFALWFSNFPTYLGLIVLPVITQLHWLAVTLVVVVLLAFARDSWSINVNFPLIAWWIAFTCMTLISFAANGGGEQSILVARLAGLTFFAVAYIAFATSPDLVAAMRRSIAYVVILSVFLNCYQLLNPFAYVPMGHEFALIGRTSGIYVNPNSSGAALVLGIVISTGMVTPQLRAAFVSLAGIGILLTFSRAAVLGYVIAIIGLFVSGVLARRSLIAILSAAAICIAAAMIFIWPIVSDAIGGAGGIERLLWFLNPEERADFSANERTYLAELGWQQFLEHPLVGNGIGSTELWMYRSSTHNQYLQLMSDFGIAGAFVLPGLLGAILYRKRGAQKQISLIVLVCVGLWGLVTHNIFTEYYWLVAIALVAAFPESKPEST